ncbi:ribokinase [Bacillus sp. FJAT-50079]|nr:ribokinase [Bacillus sp. FJAT-50079]MBS4206690.1 ribokinase [Bacillus sp. FJAT-50079]
MGKILIIGSLNMDLVSHVSHLPQAGETISSFKFQEVLGGKGANQAVAAAKLGANVSMIGKVGADDYGKALRNGLEQSGVNTKGIRIEGSTGMAFITVSKNGENTIVLVPGANSKMKRSDINQLKYMIEQSDIIIMQLEIPFETVEYTIQLAEKQKKDIILNPAPAQQLPYPLLKSIHTLIPNETELHLLTGMPTSTINEVQVAAHYLKSLGLNRIIVTMGEKGSYLINGEQQIHIPAYRVKSIDTTAAGDAFIGAFAVGVTKGMDDQKAAEFATKVSAIVVTKEGAQPSLPTLEEVDRFYS